ncbi:MAG: sterol desaturase family protein [Steroidobacteraceae bacterium]
MRLLSFEYSPAAYRADFISYGTAVAGLSAVLIVRSPRARALELAAFVVAGLAVWTVIEYVMHRFVMHGLDPIRRWHAQHHRHTTALIGAPTLLTATAVFLVVFLPAVAATDVWRGSALTLGVVTGYLCYGITHHAVHQWHGDNAWLRRRKRWHALHHDRGQHAWFGVTTSFWDHVFRTAPPIQARPSRARNAPRR